MIYRNLYLNKDYPITFYLFMSASRLSFRVKILNVQNNMVKSKYFVVSSDCGYR